MFKFTFWMCNF